MKNKNKYQGCLIGGAVGDALGYAVEFFEDKDIFYKYGEYGIREYSLVNGKALISDDTQMTLFTANGLLCGATKQSRWNVHDTYYLYVYIAECYMDWLKTQTAEYGLFEKPNYAWLNNVPEMNHKRAPGRTCLSYLMYRNLGSVKRPRNNSKGCGGIMRVAPIGLFFNKRQYSSDQIDMLGANVAAITHGHPLGYIPAAFLVHIIHVLVHSDSPTILNAVIDAKNAICRLFPDVACLSELLVLIDKAVELSQNKDIDDLEAIREIGEGWVAEETLAIAIYCSLKYENNFEKAIIAAVNHSGDSDSTGSITGNVLGAYLGINAIPEKFLNNLELKETILEIADDLYRFGRGFCQDKIWEQKYISHTYPISSQVKQMT